MAKLVNKGSIDDIRAHLRLAEPKMTVKELQQEIMYEQCGQNRKSVIDLLNAAIKRKSR